MATPAYATVLSQINTFIIANGNNEITANVLNPILRYILDFSNNNIGDLEALTTNEKQNIVDSINSLKQAFDNLSNNGIQLFTGINNPNDTPPTTYNYADFYMQLDVDDLPIKLWQWNGFQWVDGSVGFPSNNFKFIQKGFGNTLPTPEAGDIYCGWSNDGTIRYSEALYISGSLDNSDNFTPLVQTLI